jgi:hypothetical protein
MNIKTDTKNNKYIELDNLRITYVKRENRHSKKDWPEADVLRFQAYRDMESKQLHQGAEYPVHDEESAFKLLEGISKILSNRK